MTFLKASRMDLCTHIPAIWVTKYYLDVIDWYADYFSIGHKSEQIADGRNNPERNIEKFSWCSISEVNTVFIWNALKSTKWGFFFCGLTYIFTSSVCLSFLADWKGMKRDTEYTNLSESHFINANDISLLPFRSEFVFCNLDPF